MTERLYLDIENTDDELLLVSWAEDDMPAGVDVKPGPASPWVPFVADPRVIKVCQSDHDLWWLRMHGYEVAGEFEDTKTMAWVHDENQDLDLGSLVARYVGGGASKEKHIYQRGGKLVFEDSKGTKWDLAAWTAWPPTVRVEFITYGMNDVVTLRQLHHSLAEVLAGTDWAQYYLSEERPYSRVLLDMECRGMPVDLDRVRELAATIRERALESERKLRALAQLPEAFNLNSPDQMRLYLFEKWFSLPARYRHDEVPDDPRFHLKEAKRLYSYGQWVLQGRNLAPTPPPKKKGKRQDTGLPSTEAKELLYKHGSDRWVQEYCLEYKRMNKLLSTYLDKFERIAVDDRIYGRYNQTGTVTGRASSYDPNLQNIPARRDEGKAVRRCFRGNLVVGDYDALEMRLMAHFSRDPVLVKVFADGGDPHQLLADKLGIARDAAKTLNYGIGYGGGAKTMAQSLTLAGFPTTQSVAGEYLELMEHTYARLFRWRNRVIWDAKESGFVNTLGGRARRIATWGSDDWTAKSYGERQAANALVQGSAADIVRRVMLRVDRAYPELRLIGQIHDELLWEYDEEPKPHVLEALQVDCELGHGFDLLVPLTFVPKVCEDWSQK